MREDFVITDANGRTVSIRLIMDNSFVRVLQRGVMNHPGPFYADWQALTFGALGAQSGRIRIIPGSASAEIFRCFDLALKAQLTRGVEQILVMLKRWMVNNNLVTAGTGTLMHGVNLGLRAGEITWSRLSPHRH